MARRKSRKKPLPKKKQEKLDTEFNCPFCCHEKSVTCFINLNLLFGGASCRICEERFCTNVTRLTEPIDIYSEWIDECERVNNIEHDGD